MKRSRLNSDHTTQDRSKGYSLWLMPTGRVYSELTRLIFRLSREWSTDNFEPHVTLLGGLLDSEEAILSKTSQLAAWIRPYEIKLTTMDYLDEFFRCLFFRVENNRVRDGRQFESQKPLQTTTRSKTRASLELDVRKFWSSSKRKDYRRHRLRI